ncbi:hypothetical protein O0I10_007853 [Lichtheimia ornata]|uniref:Uncharacterized protein n=1 Tax=Lichtheimia ornata TaxID=688661 RepID=A0AAD7V0D4_9FUNG|nr:uncharacterized protein O0I10_007853 [Lichtheimia ornata]KAJ8656530.1 hypothetical protein O0I10_007853 [Lichtheimia ornata]
MDFDFDDDVFVSKEKRTIPEQEPYTAKEEVDGWFHNFDSYEDLMMQRHGPNQLKSAIEHDYMYKRYERALDGALKYIELANTEDCKVSSTREMSEIAIHCALHLNRIDLAEQLTDTKQVSMETGSIFLEARVYAACPHRQDDAVSAIVRYQKLRKQDYQAWRLLATIMRCNDDQSMRNHIAKLAIERAIRIMTSSRWAMNVPVVKKRYEHELSILQSILHDIPGGDASKFLAWMMEEPLTDERMVQAGLTMFKPDDIDFIFRQAAKYSDQENEEDKERNPREL